MARKKYVKSPQRYQTDPNELNPGVRLYQKGIKLQEEKERVIKETKEVMKAMEVDGLDFKPKINRSKSI